MQLFKKTNIDFIGKRYAAFIFSGILLSAGIVSLVMKGGPKLGIDFTGGTLVQLGFKQTVPLKDLRALLASQGYADAELQDFAEEKSVIIRVQESKTSAILLGEQLQKLIQEKFPGTDPIVQRAEFVGPAVGKALSN